MVSHPTAVCYGPADLYLGMLSSLMNNLGEAQQLFTRATALCEKSAPNMWLPHIRYRHAQVLKRHNFSGGKSGYDELVYEVRSSAKSMNMVNLLARIDNLEDNNATPNRDKIGGLTRRELEILHLHPLTVVSRELQIQIRCQARNSIGKITCFCAFWLRLRDFRAVSSVKNYRSFSDPIVS